ADEPTVDELVTTMAQDDGIEFTLGAVPLARENLTPRTQEGLAVKDAMVLKTGVKRIKLAPITKFGAEIDAQVNIATDAFGNDLLNQAFIGDRFSGDQEIQAFAGLERDLVNILY